WSTYQNLYPSDVQMDFVPLDLEQLTDAFFEQKGLYNGDWDIVHINTHWVARAYETDGLFVLNDSVQTAPPEDYANAWSDSLTGLQNFKGSIYGLPSTTDRSASCCGRTYSKIQKNSGVFKSITARHWRYPKLGMIF